MRDVLAIDGSHYQQKYDGRRLRDGGVELGILKTDHRFLAGSRELAGGGIQLGAYTWCDPTAPVEAQCEAAIRRITGAARPVRFMAVDFEQWWAVWGQWYQAVAHKVTWAMVRRIAPRIISRRGHAMAAWFDEHTDLPVVVYTSYGFVSSYAGEAASWLGRYPSWISHWKEQPATRVRLSWEQIRESWLPRYEPLCPPGVLSPAVVGHQFSGDRILAPGVYTDPAGTVAGPTDLSVFDREWLARI